jgi:adenosylmethionine-8-amino-7-oxononanoate aminotransferase
LPPRGRGLIIRPIGGAVVIAPPFIIAEARIASLFDILRQTLDEARRGLSG